jgi:hypothetical protein
MTTIFVVPARQATLAGGIDSSQSIPGLLKRLQIWAPGTFHGGGTEDEHEHVRLEKGIG